VQQQLSPAFPLSWETWFEDTEQPATVRITGMLDRAGAPALQDHLPRLQACDCRPIVLDLAGVTFMDVGGYQLLCELGRTCQESGYEIILRTPSAAVRRLLEVVGWPSGLL
jgi:anti-anti-sigma factor